MEKREAIRAGILGLVVGDALGVPYESARRSHMEAFPAEGMVGFGSHYQPRGTWSDDSSMVLATMASFAERGCIDPEDIMYMFCRWLYQGHFTAHGRVFDCGNTVSEALDNFWFYGMEPAKCGKTGTYANGNGALMRILPLAFLGQQGMERAAEVSALTHNHPCSIACCRTYLKTAQAILAGDREGWKQDYRELAPYEGLFEHLKVLEDDRTAFQSLRSSGFVVDTLTCAYYCLTHTDSYRDCLLMAVNLGGDTDTLGAVVGGLAGLLYGVGGEKGIPEAWLNDMAWRDYLEEAVTRFADAVEAAEKKQNLRRSD